MSSNTRSNFGSRFAFIMALSGSAIGLGNIWRFPYMLGENGGAAFFIIYAVCCVLVSLPIFCCESIVGRYARQSAYGALNDLAPGSKWKYLGLATVISAFIIVSFYSVVGGWSVNYLVRSCTGRLQASTNEEATALFTGLSTGTLEPLVFFAIFLSASAYIVARGVNAGIETFSKYATPALGILITIIAVYSVTLPGSGQGLEYLLKPDWSQVTASTIANAMGQSFFSMSLGAGAVLIYSSFMKKQDSILASGALTALFDTLFALIAAFAVIPAVFSAGLEPGAGPSLVFETLPFIFTKMSADSPIVGQFITITFFVTIVIAALTSSISMFEVCVEQLVDHFGMKRAKASMMVLSGALVLGSLNCLSFGRLSFIKIAGNNIFSFCDILSSNFLMTISAGLFSIFVGWKMDREEVRKEFTNNGTLKCANTVFPVLVFLIKWVIPVMIAVIFVFGLGIF